MVYDLREDDAKEMHDETGTEANGVSSGVGACQSPTGSFFISFFLVLLLSHLLLLLTQYLDQSCQHKPNQHWDTIHASLAYAVLHILLKYFSNNWRCNVTENR